MPSNQLPNELKNWSQWLTWFDEDISQSINSLLRALTPLTSEKFRKFENISDDISGFDRLSRRGHYQNLLLSEWAIFDSMPEEFIRRACESEQLFLQPSAAKKKNNSRILVLFDSGPHQLGACRVAHIALWILLLRRAQKNASSFYWGILQQEKTISSESDQSAILKLLSSRSMQTIGEQQLIDWKMWLDTNQYSDCEIWAVSNDLSIPKQHWISNQLSISTDFFIESLDITKRSNGSSKKINVKLPENKISSRLLNGHFISHTHNKVHQITNYKISLQQSPFFSVDGNRLAVSLLDASALVFKIPQQSDEKLQKPIRQEWEKGQELFSACVTGKRLCGIVVTEKVLNFWQFKGGLSLQRDASNAWSFTFGKSSWKPMFLHHNNSCQYIYFLDSHQNLFLYSRNHKDHKKPAELSIKASNVSQISPADGNALIVAYVKSNSIAIDMITHGNSQNCYLLPGQGKDTRIFIGSGSAWRNGKGCWAIEQKVIPEDEQHQQWIIYRGEGKFSKFSNQEYRFGLNLTIHGVLDVEDEILLIAVSGNKKELVTINKNHSRIFASFSSTIKRVSIHAIRNLIAVITYDRQLFVYSATTGQLLLSSKSIAGDSQND